MAKSFSMFVGASVLDSQISTVRRSGAKFQALTHKVAVSILSHIDKCGDIRHVALFLNAMPKSSRTNSLAKWFEQFGPLVILSEKGEFSATHVKGKATNVADAIEMPYWDFKAPEGQDYQPLDIVAMLKGMVKKLELDAVKAKRDNDGIIAGLTLQIRTLELQKDVLRGGAEAVTIAAANAADARETVN